MEKIKNFIKVKYLFVGMVAAIYTIFIISCSMPNGDIKVIITENNGKIINDILVIPLYDNCNFGISAGPDGVGSKTGPKYIITKPFVYNGEDNFMSYVEKSKGIIIPPVIFIGNNKYVDSWLLVKNGFLIKLIHRSDVFGGANIVMKKTIKDVRHLLLESLLDSNRNQLFLRQQFDLGDTDKVETNLDNKSIYLLNKYLGRKA